MTIFSGYKVQVNPLPHCNAEFANCSGLVSHPAKHTQQKHVLNT